MKTMKTIELVAGVGMMAGGGYMAYSATQSVQGWNVLNPFTDVGALTMLVGAGFIGIVGVLLVWQGLKK